MNTALFILLTAGIFISSCTEKPGGSAGSNPIRDKDIKLCDSLKLDRTMISFLRQHYTGNIEAFRSAAYPVYSEDTTAIPRIPGITFEEPHKSVYDKIYLLKDSMRKNGYTIFLLDAHFDHKGKKDVVAILKSTDPFLILRQIGTDGINYDITNDSLITLVKRFDEELQLELIGASQDYCEFAIHRRPASWGELAARVYKVCPDVVEQGAGSITALAKEMSTTRRLYFWWD